MIAISVPACNRRAACSFYFLILVIFPEMTADAFIVSFFIYSVLGYFCEVAYCSIPQRRFVNRGFLYGPYLPIYGFGAAIVTVIISPLHAYPVLVFLLAFLLTSCLEYFSSWLLEALFSVKLWDYSKHRVNINGRVCLLNSTLFGIMGLVLEYAVDPPVMDLLSRIPSAVMHYLSVSIVALLSADTALSVMKMKAFRDGLRRIHEAAEDIDARVKALQGEGKTELAAELRARLTASAERYREDFRKKAGRILLANPTLTARSREIGEELDLLSEWVRERRALRARQRKELKELDDRHREAVRKVREDD